MRTRKINSNPTPQQKDFPANSEEKPYHPVYVASPNRSKTLVEIAGFPPPMGSWSLRIEFVAQEWRERGYPCMLMNIGRSRKLNNPKYLNIRGMGDFILKVTQAAVRGHVLHTHTNAKGVKGTLIMLCAQGISALLGRRCVLTFHAGVKQEYFPRTGKFWLDTLLWLTFKTPRAIICNSPNVKEHIVRDYGVPESKVYPIPAFCAAYMRTELGTLSPGVAAFAEQHEPLLVSYVFFFHPEFTVDLMVKAVHRLRKEFPGLGLIIMGSKQYAENYVPLIEKLELNEHIFLTGNLPRPEFLAVLARGALYLRTPMGDGVAASVLEALSLSTPVVASDNGARPPSCILYKGGDLEDMVHKVCYVLNNHKQVVAQIVKPEGNDTLEQEVDLLLSV
ncbi:glycosyltransferase family 4 protein [Candidatus Poribacteria bacterium]|nr:glycosyltransferase family 4 protein [Candidatus Poribacteria bacterium]